MVRLVEYADITNRLSQVPGFALPSSITSERVRDYIEEATGVILNASGYDAPPVTESRQRQALDGLCVRLVINMIRMDLFSMDAAMLQVLRLERQDILKEATSMVAPVAASPKFMFETPGARP